MIICFSLLFAFTCLWMKMRGAHRSWIKCVRARNSHQCSSRSHEPNSRFGFRLTREKPIILRFSTFRLVASVVYKDPVSSKKFQTCTTYLINGVCINVKRDENLSITFSLSFIPLITLSSVLSNPSPNPRCLSLFSVRRNFKHGMCSYDSIKGNC